eukprot:Skav209204  [mRNA]  locus=scaffold2666:83104:94664:- [translate_table: standard]
MDRSSDKLFEYAREVNHYCELRPDSELAKIKIVPSYILVGDQSSGKTSLLSRLARMPLGYTANKTGTRRPVEYNLIHDPTKHEPEIEEMCCVVALNDFKDGKWFQCQIPAQIAKGQGDQELQFQADSKPEYLNKLATIDILCRNVKVTVKQVCISKAKSPETNADSGSEAGGVEENPGATEVMKIATNLVSHMSSNFKPLQGFAATGIRAFLKVWRLSGMDFRKLMVDLSCELVEQTVSFRELLEKRLGMQAG